MKGGMRGGGGQMGNLLKQAQKMQKQMAQAQEELEEMEVEATSGGGMVTVVVNGKNEIVDMEIKPDAVDPEDVEMLEDLVISAVNEAMRKSSEMASEHMGKITGPMQGMLPPGMGF